MRRHPLLAALTFVTAAAIGRVVYLNSLFALRSSPLPAAAPAAAQLGPASGLIVKINPARDPDWLAAQSFAACVMIQVGVSWSQLEPQDGVYDWTVIDSYVSQAAPKAVLLMYGSCGPGASQPSPAREQGVSSVSPTPSWFFALPGAQTLSAPGIDPRPVFWDEVYLARQEKLISAIGARYRGHRSLSWRICGWSDASNEPGAYNELNANAAFQSAFRAAAIPFSASGRKPVFSGSDAYSLAVLRLMRAWRTALPSSRLWLTVHFPGEDQTTLGLDAAMVDLGRQLRMVLGNTGLNCGDKSSANALLTQWRTGSIGVPPVQVGWFSLTNVGGPCPNLSPAAQWDAMLAQARGAPLSYLVTNVDTLTDHGAQLSAFAPYLVP